MPSAAVSSATGPSATAPTATAPTATAPTATAPSAAAPSASLVAEATRRSGVLWLAPPEPAPTAPSSPAARPALLWHVWHAGAAYVVCNGDEQPLAPPGPVATVQVRGASGACVVHWVATVSVVEPGSALWDEVTPLLAAERLNAASAQGLPERWAASSTVLQLLPLATPPPPPPPTSR